MTEDFSVFLNLYRKITMKQKRLINTRNNLFRIKTIVVPVTTSKQNWVPNTRQQYTSKHTSQIPQKPPADYNVFGKRIKCSNKNQ